MIELVVLQQRDLEHGSHEKQQQVIPRKSQMNSVKSEIEMVVSLFVEDETPN